MTMWHRTLLGALVALTLPAGPALAERRQPADAAQAASGLQRSGYDLAVGQLRLASRGAVVPGASHPAQRYRAAVAPGPSVDLWANLPNPSMSYRTGKRGPVIELGAFGGDLGPPRAERDAPEESALAHVSLAWTF